MTIAELVLYAWLAAAIIMLITWGLQLRSQNAGVVDVSWVLLTPVVGLWLILADDVGNSTRQYLVIFMALFWGIRLGLYLSKRAGNETEDGRYRYLREYCGKRAQAVFFIFFQMQAAWAILFALPFWAASRNSSASLTWLDYLGLATWLIAIVGEWLSDRQLAQFKSRVQDRSRVCKEGLWRYSRHPNYFFEWLHWFAYVLVGYGSDYWWLCWSGLIVMYVFITRITGVPYTEQQSLRSKGDAYREYQQSTSMFFPLPPKNIRAMDSQLRGASHR